jgi:hypothetical protein
MLRLPSLIDSLLRGGNAMFRQFLAATIVLALVSAVNADVTVFLSEQWGINNANLPTDGPEPVNGTGGGYGYLPDSGQLYYNFRLVIDVVDDDWNSIELNLGLDHATFYQDPLGDDYPPQPAFLSPNPDLEYDSYFTVPEGWPNSEAGEYPGFYPPAPTWTSTTVSARWFDTTSNFGSGTWYLASFTVIPDPGYETSWLSYCWGSHYQTSTPGIPYDFSFFFQGSVPEPGSAALLAIATVALLLRRR